MPKKDIAQELKEKFAQGDFKPSQLKKSRSAEDITNPSTPPLQKSKSAEELTSPHLSLPEQIKQLKQELAFTECTAQNYLERLQLLTAEFSNLESELKEKANSKIEKANERVRKYQDKISQLEQEKITLTDQNLELRLKALKDFSAIRENQQGIEQAVERLVKTEQTQINYAVQNKILLREKGDLQKQLGLAQQRIQKLYQLKGLPSDPRNVEINWVRWALIGLMAYGMVWWMQPKGEKD